MTPDDYLQQWGQYSLIRLSSLYASPSVAEHIGYDLLLPFLVLGACVRVFYLCIRAWRQQPT